MTGATLYPHADRMYPSEVRADHRSQQELGSYYFDSVANLHMAVMEIFALRCCMTGTVLVSFKRKLKKLINPPIAVTGVFRAFALKSDPTSPRTEKTH
jgi:hypothetical protein